MMRQRLIAEALGTGLLLAIVVGSGIMGEQLANGNAAIALLANSLATGAGLFVLIVLFGSVSGAHFNPAVSMIAALRGELPPRDLMLYVAVQVGGAILGVWAAHAMFSLDLLQASLKVRTGPSQWWAEFVASFGLVLTILGTTRSKKTPLPLVAAMVGLYIMAAYWFTASTSFANPAVTIARALTDTFAGIRPADAFGFILAQCAGAFAGNFVAEIVFGKPE